MKPENQLIQLFLWVCAVYDKYPTLKYQRWSPNPTAPAFTDQEVLTVYLFGHLQGHCKQVSIHRYIQQHWGAWFPKLPSYQAFNYRLNLLHEVWPVLLGACWRALPLPVGAQGGDQLLDSLPIMLAVRGRSCQAKVAREQADQGYCESKQLYYHGVKLHLLGAKQYQQLPVPLGLCLRPASQHDLPVLKERSCLRCGAHSLVTKPIATKRRRTHSPHRARRCVRQTKKKRGKRYTLLGIVACGHALSRRCASPLNPFSIG